MIKIYTSSTCHWCHEVMNLFKKHNIKYQELNCSENSDYRDEVVRKTGQRGVPVIEVGNKIIIGYNEDKLKDIILIEEHSKLLTAIGNL